MTEIYSLDQSKYKTYVESETGVEWSKVIANLKAFKRVLNSIVSDTRIERFPF